MTKKQPMDKAVATTDGVALRLAAQNKAAVALSVASFCCLGVLAAAGIDVKVGAGAIVAVLLAVTKVCTSLGYR